MEPSVSSQITTSPDKNQIKKNRIKKKEKERNLERERERERMKRTLPLLYFARIHSSEQKEDSVLTKERREENSRGEKKKEKQNKSKAKGKATKQNLQMFLS